MIDIHPDRPVADIVADDDRTAPVFVDHGIDFCCRGDQTLQEACEANDVALGDLRGQLEEVVSVSGHTHEYRDWSLGFLVDYIVNEYHQPTRSRLREIEAHAETVADVHGEEYPETREIHAIWTRLAPDMEEHLRDEEENLFPLLRGLGSTDGPALPEDVDLVGLIDKLEDDHEETAQRLEELEELSDRFTAPEGACNAFRGLYRLLEEFDARTRRHVHLENHVLFDRVVDRAGTNDR